MDKEPPDEEKVELVWRSYLTTGTIPDFANPFWYESRHLRPLARILPSEPRCQVCYYPFHGIGGKLVQTLFNLKPSKMNPHLCNVCENFANKYQGGAEIELSMMFADIRGSTSLAEKMSPTEFSRLIDRFYRVTTRVLYRANALVEKLIGDEVTGLFVPGFAGPNHADTAISAAKSILRETGHADPSGPWVPVGIGIHSGLAFVGSVSAEGGRADITALGDAVNTASRLASVANSGEIVVSDVSQTMAGLNIDGLESRNLELKGRSDPIDVWV
jgi:adenylate cyclase